MGHTTGFKMRQVTFDFIAPDHEKMEDGEVYAVRSTNSKGNRVWFAPVIKIGPIFLTPGTDVIHSDAVDFCIPMPQLQDHLDDICDGPCSINN